MKKGRTNKDHPDQELIKSLAQRINEMPDREEAIARLRAHVESRAEGPTSSQIAEAILFEARKERNSGDSS